MRDTTATSLSPHLNESTVIATPIWRERPNPNEFAFLRHTDLSNSEVTRWFCAPRGLDAEFYERNFPEWKIERFPDIFFSSVAAYSNWLTTPIFYEHAAEFEFVTICQLDAVLQKDVRTLDMSGVDYVGAPWVPPIKVLTPGNRIYISSGEGGAEGMWVTKKFGRFLSVGNGGLSVRRIDKHIKMAEWLAGHVPERYRATTQEDALICAFASRTGLRVAPSDVAGRVFLESGAAGLTALPDVYGFHALWRWNPALAQEIAAKFV